MITAIEFHWLVARNDLTEIEEQQVSCYIGGLQSQFQDQLNLLDPYSVSEAHQQALQLEKQLSRHTNDSNFWGPRSVARLLNSIISRSQILQIKLVNLVKTIKAAKTNPRVWDYVVLIAEKVGTK